MKNNDLIVPLSVLNEIIKYKQETLILVNELILNTKNKIIKKSLSHISESEIYYMLEYHQKVFVNFLYFKENAILNNYLHWFYRVYINKDLELEFFQLIYKLWITAYSKYLNKSMMIHIEKFYNFLIKNNHDICEEAIRLKTFYIDTESNELYELLVNSQKNTFKERLYKNSCSNEEFLNYFSTYVVKAMKKVGFMWEIGKINVAKEHIASAILEEICFEVINSFKDEEQKNKSILIVNAPNEFHGLGLKFISRILEKLGYKIINLGSNGTPKKDIIRAVNEFKPDYVILGVSLSINLYEVAMIIKEIQKSNLEIEILVGGNACNELNNPNDSLKSNKYFKDIRDIIGFFSKN